MFSHFAFLAYISSSALRNKVNNHVFSCALSTIYVCWNSPQYNKGREETSDCRKNWRQTISKLYLYFLKLWLPSQAILWCFYFHTFVLLMKIVPFYCNILFYLQSKNNKKDQRIKRTKKKTKAFMKTASESQRIQVTNIHLVQWLYSLHC